MTQYFAHSANKADSPWEPLEEHLRLVAKRAKEYASYFDAGREAWIAGLLHDLGKYSDAFLKRLHNKTSGLDHWSAGAFTTLDKYKDKALAAALAIQGHHIGLQEGSGPGIKAANDIRKLASSDTHPLGLRLTEPNMEALMERFMLDGFDSPGPPAASLYDRKAKSAAGMLDERMLFSTLVDADFIETEAHFQGKADGAKVYRSEGPELKAERALEIVMGHIAKLGETVPSSENVRNMRQDLLEVCLDAAKSPSGVFTLTAPTGAGKTLAMLAFALKHATVYPQIRRIVMIVPFLSIIEQTALVYKRLLEPHFDPHYVLEHHSLADVSKKNEDKESNRDDEEEARRTARLLSENWDAPLILTTSVQFFESLFSNRPGKCRKLHRLANSVILFDEVQTLPPKIAVPTLAALSRLAERYGCTVVFSTATQPAFGHLHERVKQYADKGWSPRPIGKDTRVMFQHARRVRIDWKIDKARTWESIADELATKENERVLCIVNLKRHAQRLAELLRERIDDDGLFHLSTSMCPAHREKTLNEVRKRLDPTNPRPCRLISTQCIEAGVDVDFPAVWRAFGPLDAIAQAAGRCNREGRLDGLGQMVVFLPEKDHQREYLYPPGGYKEATDTTLTLFNMKRNESERRGIPLEDAFNIYDPELFNEYYRLLYDLTGATELAPDLDNALKRRSFADVAKHYEIIGRNSINVLVPYPEEMALFESLKAELNEAGRLTRDWILEARPLTVSLYRPKNDATVWNYLDPVPLGRGATADDWFVYLNAEDYDPLFGLKKPNVDVWMI